MDVAAGYIVRFRRSLQAKVVMSREPAHPVVVSAEPFRAAQLEKRKRRTGGSPVMRGRRRSSTTGVLVVVATPSSRGAMNFEIRESRKPQGSKTLGWETPAERLSTLLEDQ